MTHCSSLLKNFQRDQPPWRNSRYKLHSNNSNNNSSRCYHSNSSSSSYNSRCSRRLLKGDNAAVKKTKYLLELVPDNPQSTKLGWKFVGVFGTSKWLCSCKFASPEILEIFSLHENNIIGASYPLYGMSLYVYLPLLTFFIFCLQKTCILNKIWWAGSDLADILYKNSSYGKFFFFYPERNLKKEMTELKEWADILGIRNTFAYEIHCQS